MKFLLFAVLCCTLVNVTLLFPTPTQPYANTRVLVEPDQYALYWNYTDSDILFEIHVKTTGWISFGLSPNGNMLNSDMIVTWVKADGSVNFSDRNTKSQKVIPAIDAVPNWFSLLTITRDGYTIAKFTRKIKICDKTGDDLDIEGGTPYVIFAWGDSLVSNDIYYHGRNRGSKTLPLISSLNTKTVLDMSQVEITDFKVNVINRKKDVFFVLNWKKCIYKNNYRPR